MGVSVLWDVVKRYNENIRIPFSIFVCEYRLKHGRSPKIAIDAYQWLFECGFFTSHVDNGIGNSSWSISEKAVLNFVIKLKEFIALDLDFVLVFDGVEKPNFKQRFRSKRARADEPSYQNDDIELKVQNYIWKSDPVVNEVSRICEAFNVAYIVARGEGEAQCAWLQRCEVVDYVLSNDSDSLVFGATKILRNFSKYSADLPSSGTSPVKKHVSEYFVSIVDMDNVRVTNPTVNYEAFLLFIVLVGADYNKGVRHFGFKRAWAITQWNNGMLSKLFARMCEQLKLKSSRINKAYEIFKRSLMLECFENSKQIFGQNLQIFTNKVDFDTLDWPTIEVLQSYYNPKIFTKNYHAELFQNENSSMGPPRKIKKLYELLESLGLPNILKDFDSWYHNMLHSSMLLKSLLYDKNAILKIKITGEKQLNLYEEFKIPLWRVRYSSFLSDVKHPEQVSTESPSLCQLETKEYPNSQWVVKNFLPDDHEVIVRYLNKKYVPDLVRKRTRPKTRSPDKSQTTTLDFFINSTKSPLKRRKTTDPDQKQNLEPIIISSSSSDDESLTILGSPPPSLEFVTSLKSSPLNKSTLKKDTHVHFHQILTEMKEPARLKYWFSLFFEYAPNHNLDQQAIWKQYTDFVQQILNIENLILNYHDLPHILEHSLPGLELQFSTKGSPKYIFQHIRQKEKFPLNYQGLKNTRRRLVYDDDDGSKLFNKELSYRGHDDRFSVAIEYLDTSSTTQRNKTIQIGTDTDTSLDILD